MRHTILGPLSAESALRIRHIRSMIEKANTLFPEACEYDQPQYWAGLRPMTPEGTPIIGKGRHQNLIYNTGHGHMGWTMSCGAARITADVVSGRTPEFDISGMGVR